MAWFGYPGFQMGRETYGAFESLTYTDSEPSYDDVGIYVEECGECSIDLC